MSDASCVTVDAEATLTQYERGVPWGLAACYAGFVVLMVWRIL